MTFYKKRYIKSKSFFKNFGEIKSTLWRCVRGVNSYSRKTFIFYKENFFKKLLFFIKKGLTNYKAYDIIYICERKRISRRRLSDTMCLYDGFETKEF